MSQLGANIASCEVNTTTFESTDRPVSTYSLVWEDRPLSNFSHGTGSLTYQPAPLHGSERWFKFGSPFFSGHIKVCHCPVSPMWCGFITALELTCHCHRPLSYDAPIRSEQAVSQFRYRSCDACAKKWISWFALHVTSNLWHDACSSPKFSSFCGSSTSHAIVTN